VENFVINFEKQDSRDMFYEKVFEELDTIKTVNLSLENLTQ